MNILDVTVGRYRVAQDYAGHVAFAFVDGEADRSDVPGVVATLAREVARLRAEQQAVAEVSQAPWKDHQTAQLVNDLRDCAIQYHSAGQLRARIAHLVAPLCDQLKAAPAQAQDEARLEKPARVGCGTFGIGVPSRLVVEAAQRLFEFEGKREAMTPDEQRDMERRRRELWDMMNGPFEAQVTQRANMRGIAQHALAAAQAPAAPVARPHHCTARSADGACEECEGHAQAMAEWHAETHALGQAQEDAERYRILRNNPRIAHRFAGLHAWQRDQYVDAVRAAAEGGAA